jgi:hypothetical protein
MSNISTTLEEYFSYNKNYKKNNSNFFSQIYNNIIEGFNFIEKNKKNKKNNFYKISIENNLQNPSDFNSIPSTIRENIKNNLFNYLSFDFLLFGRKIKIYFILNNPITKKIIQKYTNFVFLMTTWLYIISIYSSQKCSQKLDIYIYLSSSLKKLPIDPNIILNQEHANTAFTRLCSEIIIYRQEEWFKVFIHETIHNFNLDFSNMNTQKCNQVIKNIFHVNSNVNLYESYTEFWARIINISFISYIHTNNFNNFTKVFEKLINIEISYSMFQMIKILDYMNLTYDDLINIFQENYKENTNILSYYIITNILIFNYVDFLSWCNNNNNNLYDFKKTNKNLFEFCQFIKNKYNNNKFLENYDKINLFFIKNKNKNKAIPLAVGDERSDRDHSSLLKNNNKKINYLMNNLRMTIYELV